jgi:hypothetical protein
MRQLYDQTAAETDYAAELSGPHLYKDNIYYVEVKWPGYVIANSNKKYQFALGTYAWQNYWNPTDDWSHQGLKVVEDSWKGVPEKTDNICVYNDGVLVGGIEPDGTTPGGGTTTIINGDINSDTQIDALDLTLLKMHLLGSKPLEGDALKAADVDASGTVDALDLLQLKRYLLGQIEL